MFLERGAACFSFGTEPLAVPYATLRTLSTSYLPDNEQEGAGESLLTTAHDITKRDQVNIVNIEKLLFSLKRKGATKQMRINYFFIKKQCKLDLTVEIISLVYVF
jgi:hypothetical protein